MNIGVAQIRLTESIEYNCSKILQYIEKAKEENIEVLSFPETALTGYIYDDFLSADFGKVENEIDRIQASLAGSNLCVILGTPLKVSGNIYNSAIILHPNGNRDIYNKQILTNYENKYFKKGEKDIVFNHNGINFGVIICRDQNSCNLTRRLKTMGAKVIFILSAHYYNLIESKAKIMKNVALPIARAYENNLYVCKANTVGTIKGKVSLGNSMIVHPNGITICIADEKNEELLFYDADLDDDNFQW